MYQNQNQNQNESLWRKISKRTGRIYLLRWVYVNTVLSPWSALLKFFKKVSGIDNLQKNIHPKLSYISMYFQDFFPLWQYYNAVQRFVFFFWHKNICVNSMLTALTSPLDKEASSLTPAQQQCPGLSAFINQLHHQNMVLKKQNKKF